MANVNPIQRFAQGTNQHNVPEPLDRVGSLVVPDKPIRKGLRIACRTRPLTGESA